MVGRGGNRFAVMNAFVDVSLRHLKPAEVRVWLVLFRDAKRDGLSRTGQTDIARRTGVSVRAVGAAVRGLERAGLVKVVRRGRLNAGPSVYAVRGANPDAVWDDDGVSRSQPPPVHPEHPRGPGRGRDAGEVAHFGSRAGSAGHVEPRTPVPVRQPESES